MRALLVLALAAGLVSIGLFVVADETAPSLDGPRVVDERPAVRWLVVVP
jgi:hypothetical protein